MEIFDIIVLTALLFGISIYGLFKSLKGQQQLSVRDILHGSRVSVLSSALAVCSGIISAVSILGFPAEIYYQGGMPIWFGLAYFIAFPIVAFVLLPVLYDLKFTSIYEYLEKRFSFACRLLASLTFCLQMFLYISVALYAPALALSSITQIPLALSILITAGLSALYVSLGGAKAGIYTSSLQMALILVCLAFIFICSLIKINLSEIFSRAKLNGRLELMDFRIDPRIRHSVWSIVIGAIGTIISLFATNQLSVQRYLAMPSLRHAQWVVLLNIPINFMVLTLYTGISLIIFAFYYNCDPGLISKDRLFPYFIVNQFSSFPGLVGLFIASVFSAGMSTLSASYSALSAVIIEDVIRQYLLKMRNGTQLNANLAVKLARTLR
ncbi:unnamed protein product [Dracunculus medinensis]|uniref:Sodium-coupled monocarboxylate transporter 1 n=1 Tax=Dracunculus medinensis TaxID=318479 RepID=A0A0N4URP1_DRAME|nr:unnamed protein product [Dracunculus medinensis]